MGRGKIFNSKTKMWKIMAGATNFLWLEQYCLFVLFNIGSMQNEIMEALVPIRSI